MVGPAGLRYFRAVPVSRRLLDDYVRSMRLPKERSGFQTVHKRSITFRLGQIKEAGGATGLHARTWYRLGDASARGRFRGLRRGYFGGTVEQMINYESDSEGTSGRLATRIGRADGRERG